MIMIFIHSTFKRDCPAHISLHINVSSTALEVKSVSTEHNHRNITGKRWNGVSFNMTCGNVKCSITLHTETDKAKA